MANIIRDTAPKNSMARMSRSLVFLVLTHSFVLTYAGLFSDQNISVIEQLALDAEFSKDIASMLSEANLESNCDGNVFITTKGCADYLDYMLAQLSEWAPPVLLVTYQDFEDIGNSDLWNTFLAWKKRPCSIVFVCDLMRSVADEVIPKYNAADDDGGALGNLVLPKEDIGYLKFAKFIESSDQVLYLSDYMDDFTMNETNSGSNSIANQDDIQSKILKQSGILLQIVVGNFTQAEPETPMRIYSVCEYCGESSKWHQRDLGVWQRNKTLFGKHFHIFRDYHKLSFNSTNLSIGYFNHRPHFSCYFDGNVNKERATTTTIYDEVDDEVDNVLVTNCEGVEWEMISQMGKSLDFTTTWINLSNPAEASQDHLGETSNISNMIASFEAGKIDLAVGGISVTPKRIMYVDFSSVFANDPIVFVVEKKSNLFALGIWLAFNPEIWPLILLIIAIISLLFHIIIYQYTLNSPTNKKDQPKWSLSAFIHRQYREEVRKPLHVSMFEAFEVTLQPLLGQPLSATQITHRPRRLLKLLLILWWFSSLIISTLYNTSLITSLINPISPKEPESLQDLLDFGYRFKAAGKQGAFLELVKSITDIIPGAQDDDNDDTNIPPEELLNGASKEERRTVSLIKQISDRLVTVSSRSTSLIAYVIGESAVKGIKWDKKEIGFSQIKVIHERLFLTTYAWPTQRHAPFKKKIDSALGRLNSAGLIEYWYHEFGHRDNKEPRSVKLRLREKLGQINLNMQVLQGAFIFLIFAQTCSVLVLGVEHLTKRYKFRFFTRHELCYFYRKLTVNVKSMYAKHFAAEHEELQLRRKKNRMRFRGAVRTVSTFRKKDDFPYVK